ncbi:MAG: response regulator, partial [Candidatus Coatesbacteria bacterium]|nr:response regulator [Candidatus Coatesbacteria bacterium]
SECDIRTFVSPRQALKFIEEEGCDLLLTDFSMPAMNGVELITKVKALGHGTYSILVTGSSPYALREQYPGDVFDSLLKKPYSYRELLSLIDVGLRMREEMAAKREKPPVVEKAPEPSGASWDSAVREARAFLEKVWEEADPTSQVQDQEYGCKTAAYFAVRVKEEIDRAIRYLRALTLIKVDLNDLTQARAEFGLTQDTELAKMILRIFTPNLRNSDLVAYRHPWVLIMLPETNNDSGQYVIKRLIAALKARGIHISKSADADSSGAFSYRTFSFGHRGTREKYRENSDLEI